MAKHQELKFTRKRLARIRCVQECIDRIGHNKPLPNALCYVPLELECRVAKHWAVSLHAEPNQDSPKLLEVALTPSSKLVIAGEQHFNSHGQWSKVLRIFLKVSWWTSSVCPANTTRQGRLQISLFDLD